MKAARHDRDPAFDQADRIFTSGTRNQREEQRCDEERPARKIELEPCLAALAERVDVRLWKTVAIANCNNRPK
jgi:hypothetical protein